MAETKKKKVVSASTGKEVTGSRKKATVKKQAAPVGNATGLRVGAVILWVAAIAFELLAWFVFTGKINLTFLPVMAQLITFLVLDLICVIIGSLLWKKANHIRPASEKNKTLFWIWNNMGLIVCAFAFVPFIILALSDKKADKKTKTIAVVAAAIALLIGGATSIEYNPVSAEQQQAAMATIEGKVLWAPFGKVYHIDETCQALNQSETLTEGTVEEAIADGRTRLCAFCAKRNNVEGVVTDQNVDEVELEDTAE